MEPAAEDPSEQPVRGAPRPPLASGSHRLQLADGAPRLVLASGSPYRAAMLAQAGIPAEIDPPEVDERALDHLFDQLGAEGFALELARRKAAAVAVRHPDALVLAGDQVGVLDTADGPRQLNKQPDEDHATAQLVTMSGTTHRLVNALVLVHLDSGRTVEGIDEQRVTMRAFSEAEARGYVRRFEPYDSGGSYRLEDQIEMEPGEGFVVEVEGEHDSGVRGLPLPLVGRMLDALVAQLR
jgi:septum formation protein